MLQSGVSVRAAFAVKDFVTDCSRVGQGKAFRRALN